MPKLLTKVMQEGQPQADPCDFTDLSRNDLTETAVTLQELRDRCDRYKTYLASLQPPQGDIMIRAANFTTESVLRMIGHSPDSPFIRVYYGIGDDGRHLLFLAPVQQAGVLAKGDNTIYVDDCCACPPIRNCPGDELLG
ncbi:hypothetical protein FVR03_18775 [Pontibacter qinzhouensis]|uniref:Uncharacterized protein n=1 Tax=Pontibacter qinzhouensis TaxID=2603253 RepID=A0A5C8J8H9_9BACT|nr:hypothetical protein [Pontibacter qinzhouensis]TXK33749.1 hypothetical protein FVR03_18775 [Pontibacter qinzhouensis]